jgi:hypothetical protein
VIGAAARNGDEAECDADEADATEHSGTILLVR